MADLTNPTPETTIGTTYALLIGVDDYETFDENGGSDLNGSRNDVILIATYCVEVLRMRPENIVALTSPTWNKQDLEQHESMQGIALGDASEEEVTKRLTWLLGTPSGGTMLLTFSGHGAALPGGEPVLCLGDTAKDFKSGVLPLQTLGYAIKSAHAEGRLVALLDCCHVAAPSPHRRFQGTSLTHSVAPEDVMKQEDLFRVSDRVLLAARPGMPAYQMRLGKQWHGALTFALVTAADRWLSENEVSHGSYRHVLERARTTLKALGVPQRLEFRVPATARETIRKEPFLGVKEGDTVKKPDALGMTVQLDPTYFYLIYLGNGTTGTVLAEMVVTGTTAVYVGTSTTALSANTEHWYLNPSLTTTVGGNITITATLIPATSPGNGLSLNASVSASESFTSPVTPLGGWVPSLTAPTGGVNHILSSNNPAKPTGATAYVLLNLTSRGAAPNTIYTLAHVQWYLSGVTPVTGGALNPGSTGGIIYSTDTLPGSYLAAASQ